MIAALCKGLLIYFRSRHSTHQEKLASLSSPSFWYRQ